MYWGNGETNFAINCASIYKFDGLGQESYSSIADALELHLSYTNPSRWYPENISQGVRAIDGVTVLLPHYLFTLLEIPQGFKVFRT